MAYVAENITSNVRQLEGTVNKILAYRDMTDFEINLTNVSRAIKDMFRGKEKLLPTPQLIISEISSYYNISESIIRGTARDKNTAEARAGIHVPDPAAYKPEPGGHGGRSSARTTPRSCTPLTRSRRIWPPATTFRPWSRRSPPTSTASSDFFTFPLGNSCAENVEIRISSIFRKLPWKSLNLSTTG